MGYIAPDRNFGSFLRKRRKKLNITQCDILEYLPGHNKVYISEIETGKKICDKIDRKEIFNALKKALIKKHSEYNELNNQIHKMKTLNISIKEFVKKQKYSNSLICEIQTGKRDMPHGLINSLKNEIKNNQVMENEMNKPNANNTQTAMNEILENYTDKHSIDVAIGKLTSCLMKIEQAENAYNEASKIINNHDSFKGNAEPQLFHTEFINNLIKELLFHKFMN